MQAAVHLIVPDMPCSQSCTWQLRLMSRCSCVRVTRSLLGRTLLKGPGSMKQNLLSKNTKEMFCVDHSTCSAIRLLESKGPASRTKSIYQVDIASPRFSNKEDTSAQDCGERKNRREGREPHCDPNKRVHLPEMFDSWRPAARNWP